MDAIRPNNQREITRVIHKNNDIFVHLKNNALDTGDILNLYNLKCMMHEINSSFLSEIERYKLAGKTNYQKEKEEKFSQTKEDIKELILKFLELK